MAFSGRHFHRLAQRIGSDLSNGPPSPKHESCTMNASCPLIPIGPAMRELPVEGSRQTGFKWLAAHPGLGQRIGGRFYFYREAWAAIARGATLDEAERIGRAQAAALQAAYTGPSSESAAAP
jgi:hypothetical protein